MPELPDVVVYKRYFDRTALHKRVTGTRVFDAYVIKDITPRTLQRRVRNHSFESTQRRGKYLFVGLDGDGGWLGMHFGMTGYLEYFKKPGDTPEHTRVRFDLDNGYALTYVCLRKLGELHIINDLESFLEEHQLGPDAWKVDYETFAERIGERRGRIKSALMNQQALAGLGNIYSDEILFQAQIHPESNVADLDEAALRTIFDEMKRVIDIAVDAKANPDAMPRVFLLPHRSEGAECPRCGGTVEKIRLSGRTTYYCPECQSK